MAGKVDQSSKSQRTQRGAMTDEFRKLGRPGRGGIARLMTVIAFALAAIFLLPATIDYLGGPSICVRKLALTRNADRVVAALEWTRSDRVRNWVAMRDGPQHAAAIDQLDRATCCSIQHLGWAGEEQITFLGMVSGGPSHFVKIDALGKIRMTNAVISAPINLCGDVVERRN